VATEPQSDLRFEIGHVLFIDLVGYSKLLIEEQRERLGQLTEIVLATGQVAQTTNEQLVRLPTGDGMALVFRNSSEEPARCALEIAEVLRKHPEISVRMGIHSGPVSEVTDVNGRSNIAGAGINIAQRVMDCGDAGHILLSQRVADDLAQYRQWAPRLHDLGACEVKHGIRLHVVNLYTEEIGNPETPEKFKRAIEQEAASPTVAATDKRSRRGVIVALLLLSAALVPGILFFYRPARQTSGPAMPVPSALAMPAIPEKSIAVLPFENLSANQENGFFADGVQDEILTNLARVADLKVISRTSVMNYRRTTGRNLRQIGQELGVAHLLEGSVQRAGNRVRINAQLVDSRTDAHLWAQTYDRDLADVFAIQSEIATAIAGQLQARLSPTEKAAIEERPTKDLVAYDLYIQAKALNESAMSATLGNEVLLNAVRLLNEAIARDSNFILAYCLLARSHELLYQLGFDHSPARCAMADEAVGAALRLRPDAGETHLAQADYFYRCLLDYDRAQAELALAGRALPNNARVFELTAYVDRRQGRWSESVSNLERALELDPRNTFILTQLSLGYQWLRRYSDMAAVLERDLQLEPHNISTRLTRGSVDLLWRADLKPLHTTIEAIVTETPARAVDVSFTWFHLALCERDPVAAAHALAAIPPEGNGPGALLFPRAWFAGWTARIRGDEASARDAFTAARTEMERKVNEQPDYGSPLCVLALIDAALGRKQEAIAEVRRACELLPVSKDSIEGTYAIVSLSLVYAWSSENDLAIEQLTSILKIHGYLSYGELYLHPFWDPLRGDPRFEKMVASLAPKKDSRP
jgi:TolB-like protein/Tfp pilus assembly protein PilF